MALYSSREVQSTRYEWSVPDGANIAEFQKAVNAAWVTYRQLHGLADDAKWPSDLWCEVRIGSHAGDDGIVIAFTVERTERSAALVFDAAARERAHEMAIDQIGEALPNFDGMPSFDEAKVRALVDDTLKAAAAGGPR